MKSLLLVLGLVCVNQLIGQVTIYQSDLSNPANYIIYSPSGTDWVVTGNGPQGTNSQFMGAINSTTPSNFALFDSDFLSTISTNQDAVIRLTDAVSTIGYAYAYVCFMSYYKHDTGLINLEVSNDGGSTWVSFGVHPTLVQGDSTANPSMELIDISPVAIGGTLMDIRFTYAGQAGYAWMIDDICVIANNSPIIGLEEYADDFVKVYPNPTDGIITVDLHKFQGEVEVQITDLQGRVLASEKASPSMLSIDLALTEASGTYFVTVLHDGGQARAPFVKK